MEKIMAKEKSIETTGTVMEALRDSKFQVQVDEGDGNHIVLCTLAGKLRKNFIRIVPGDRVKIEISPYDITRGRITYRNK
jgi:translation initiation factor IF-1